MRDAIATLSRESMAILEGLRSNVVAVNEGYRKHRQDIAAQHDRAADLLEALASPPETVEELQRRATEIRGEKVLCEWWSGNGYLVVRALSFPKPMRVPGDDHRDAIRAAWFAIVGMTQEVERG